MKQIIVVCILLLSSSLTSFAQTPKGYYFTGIKGTTWISSGKNSENIKDSSLLDAAEIYISLYPVRAADTISKNVWIFADSLTIQFYDAASKTYKPVLTCAYENNERDKVLLLQLNSGRTVLFEYNSVSTGTFVGLYKKKKKK